MSLGVAPSLLPKHWSIRLRRIDPQTHMTLVTLAERPHPFPSRTRKLSSPAPKILRGQPFGKIGRRQGFCVNNGREPWWAAACGSELSDAASRPDGPLEPLGPPVTVSTATGQY